MAKKVVPVALESSSVGIEDINEDIFREYIDGHTTYAAPIGNHRRCYM